MSAWVTNILTSPDLLIEFSTDPWASKKFFYTYAAINFEHRSSHGMVNPLLESFGESPKAFVTNLKGKENPDLPSVCSNYWPPNVALSLCYNHLVLLTFRQCRSAIPQRKSKEKKTQICHRFVKTTGLLAWLSVCVLTIWYFRPFGNAGLQCPRDLPSP